MIRQSPRTILHATSRSQNLWIWCSCKFTITSVSLLVQLHLPHSTQRVVHSILSARVVLNLRRAQAEDAHANLTSIGTLITSETETLQFAHDNLDDSWEEKSEHTMPSPAGEPKTEHTCLRL